jgi:CRISPR-associated protein Csc2
MFNAYSRHFQTDIPQRPGAKYVHILVLRRTESYAVFKTDGELNTARVSAGIQNKALMARLTIFKRKQSTPERLTGRELLRRYGAVSDCEYNVKFCGECADCVLYGYAIGDTGSEKSKVYVDTAYSLSSYDQSHETMTLNAPFEDGTMTRGTTTTNRFSEQDHVLPEVYFPSVVTLRDPTQKGLAYILNNLRRTKLYGAQTTRTGHVHNEILGLIFADGEIFSNLRLVQAVHDLKPGTDSLSHEEATLSAARDLVKRDGVVYEFVEGEAFSSSMNDLDATFTDAGKLETFLKELYEETKAYAKRVNEPANTKKK